jgi:hypothetical protein
MAGGEKSRTRKTRQGDRTENCTQTDKDKTRQDKTRYYKTRRQYKKIEHKATQDKAIARKDKTFARLTRQS